MALKQHKQLRRCCNAFFLEVVSRFCFSKGQHPEEGMVELLFSLLISAQGKCFYFFIFIDARQFIGIQKEAISTVCSLNLC